ncbi:MAG: glycosyltransferase [Clostridiales bacterium]|nr:glycosyltransferase [Clostridiales bacterium]
MDEITVSIICVTYCHEKYLRKTLDGFLSQKTDFKFEILVHDDASGDDTPNIMREYEQKYPDIVRAVYQKENKYSKGVRITDEILLPMVRGKYMAFCEGDDYWCDENKLQKQVDFLESHPDYTVCVHNTRNIYLKSGKTEIPYGDKEKDLTLEDVVRCGSQSFHYSSQLVRTDFYKKLPAFATMTVMVEDYPDSIYYVLDGKVFYMPEIMSVHIIGTETSWTRTILPFHETRAQFYQDNVDMLKAANEYSDHKYDDLFTEAIEFNEYNILQSKQDYKSLVKVKKYYKREMFIVRVIYRLFSWFPFLIKISNFIRER